MKKLSRRGCGRVQISDYKGMGAYENSEIPDGIHIDGTIAIPFVDAAAIRKAKFKVAVDAVNGAGSYIVPRLLESSGCTVVRALRTGRNIPAHRNRPAEPRRSADRRKERNGCAVGFAVDPDADRCAIVDGTGKAIGEEYARDFRGRGPFAEERLRVRESSTPRMNEMSLKYGVEFSRAKVGEINVSLQMVRTK